MHERGAVGRAVGSFVAGLDRRVAAVEARIGPDVEETVVREVWAHMTEGTPADGSSLAVAVGRAGLRCFECGADYAGTKIDPCPECGGTGLVVRPVPAFEIVSWETG